jgi:hypothetical protein
LSPAEGLHRFAIPDTDPAATLDQLRAEVWR